MNKAELLKEWMLKKPKTPVLFTIFNNQKIVIKDESQNITNTYKSRQGWAIGFHYLKNIYPNNFIYYLTSTGNAGIADLVYGEMLNKLIGKQKVIIAIFYPIHYNTKKLGPDSMGKYILGFKHKEIMAKYTYGKLIEVDFNKKYWSGQNCIDKMNELGLNVNKHNSLDITEGFNPTYKSVMLELIDQIKEEYSVFPKTLVVVQFGAGILYHDSKDVIKESNLPIDILAVSTGNINTIADKIVDCSKTWQENIYDLKEKGFTFAKKSRDKIYHVEDQEILSALKKFEKLNINAEPSGAVGLAILDRLDQIVSKKYDLIAFINTGDGIINK